MTGQNQLSNHLANSGASVSINHLRDLKGD